MGLFSRRWEPDFEFDGLVAGGVVYDAYTDEDGVVFLAEEYGDLVIVPDGVLIGDLVYPAYIGEDGRVYLEDGD